MTKQQHLEKAAEALDRSLATRDGEKIEKASAEFAYHMLQAELAAA